MNTVFLPLVEREEIERAYRKFDRLMNSRGRRFKRWIGYKGGSIEENVVWHKKLGIWSCFDSEENNSRYWCAFGMEDPSEQMGLTITGEINVPFEGIKRTIAGVFIRDQAGNVYVAHSGRIGGGREGIGKELFWKHFMVNQKVTVEWPDGQNTFHMLVGALAVDLPAQVAHFVHEVCRIKQLGISAPTVDLPTEKHSFSPEFHGQSEYYRDSDLIIRQSNHGRIVGSLHRELENKGLRTANDTHRDLFVIDDHSRVSVLFEVKTDLSYDSIYGGVGQLMFHGVIQEPAPKRVVVLPGNPKPKTELILTRLGIKVLTYSVVGTKVRFDGIDGVV